MKRLFLLFAFLNVLCVGCEDLLLDVGLSNNEQTQNPIDDKIFITDSKTNYTIETEGGEVSFVITTDIAYDIIIPTEAKPWISVTTTRSDANIDKIVLTISENKTINEREAVVRFVSNNIELHWISIKQNNTPLQCASNEIYYTNGSTTLETKLGSVSKFPQIVSHTYDTEKECWVITFDSELTTIVHGAFGYSDIIKIIIPECVTAIDKLAFYKCENLESITIPQSVTSIGDSVFQGCIRLTSITLPENVTTIGADSFSGCRNLTSITLPNGITSIEEHLFYDCINLRVLAIPDNVTSIGDKAFQNCTSLTTLIIPKSVTEFGSEAFSNCAGKLFIYCDIPSAAHSLDGVFYGALFTKVTIEYGVQTIGDWAFLGCENISDITLAQSITTIGSNAFNGCTGLTSITIPSNVSSIGDYAFYNCSWLSSVYCKPTTPPTIDYATFHNNAPGLKIYVPTKQVKTYRTAQYWKEYAYCIIGDDTLE